MLKKIPKANTKFTMTPSLLFKNDQIAPRAKYTWFS